VRASVVVPVRDGEATLAQTLRSLLNQTKPPDEILVADDGSTDRSVEVGRAFAPAAQVLSGPFGGGSAARLAGAGAASGEALMFCDADDLLGPTALEELCAALEREPGTIAVCPWKRFELRDGCWLARPASCAPRRRGQDDLAAWLSGWYHPPCAVLWSRAAYEASGGWDPDIKVNQDGDVTMRALVEGVPLVPAAGGVAYYRRSPQGTGTVSARRFTQEGVRSRLAVLDRIGARLEARGLRGRYARELRNAYRQVAADAGEGLPAERARALAAAEAERPPLLPPIPARRSRRPAAAAVTPRAVPDVTAPSPDRPLVSVVVPTHNRASLLARALQSVLAQTYEHFEVLVVDDGSSEDIGSVVGALADPRLRYLRQPRNMGVAAARNRGLREAAGELVAFLDSDDRWMPGKLQRQVEIMSRRPPRVGLIYTGVAAENERGEHTVTIPTERGDVWRDMLWRNVVHFGTSGVVIRRAVVDTVGYFDEDLPAIEDYDYWLRIARFFEFEIAPEALIVYDNTASPEQERRSSGFAANMAARRMLLARYGWEAAEAGVLHRYHLESARKELEHPAGRTGAGLVHLLKAVRRQPGEPRLFLWLTFALLPRPVRKSLSPGLRGLRRRLPQALWFGRTGA